MRAWLLVVIAACAWAKAHAQDAAAHYRQAQVYGGITGEQLNRGKAFEHLRQAAGLGHVQAQVDLAFVYHNGNDVVRKDAAAALHWFRAAAAQGAVPALCLLGDYQQHGWGGLKPDRVSSFRSYERAATSGDRCAPKAQYELYASYSTGAGVRKDLATALAWLRKSAEAGNPQAQRALGRLYETGEGVGRDPRLAMAWLKKSREGVAPHDDHDHNSPRCPPWMNPQLRTKAGCV